MHPLISFIRRKILRIPADRWDYQYGQGQWEGLAAESARFDAVIELIGSHYTAPSILEIGCGEALMLRRMNPRDYSRFTGVDLSGVAIQRAARFEKADVSFIKADMLAFVPKERYDVVAFNESLYYAKEPGAVFARYLGFLRPGGSVIVTAFENKYTATLWPELARHWKPAVVREVKSGEHRWNIRMYRA